MRDSVMSSAFLDKDYTYKSFFFFFHIWHYLFVVKTHFGRQTFVITGFYLPAVT